LPILIKIFAERLDFKQDALVRGMVCAARFHYSSKPEGDMSLVHDDCFVVYIREKKRNPHRPMERQLVTCGSYQEAEMVRKENQGPDRHCIIRYTGVTGGGD
jgi:hypothetical protein